MSPKIVICEELLIIETHNKYHWIWHVLNPKYVPLKPFRCIFHSQNQKNVKFLPEILIFQEPLITDTQTCGIELGMPQTLNTCHSIHFNAFFASQNQQNVKFLAVSLTPLTKNEKTSILTGKKCLKRLENVHIEVFGYANCNALCENFV